MKPKPKKAKNKIKPVSENTKTSVMIDEREYPVGFPVCQGCPLLTLSETVGWFCFFEPNTTTCKYPVGRKAATPVPIGAPNDIMETQDDEAQTQT